MDTAVQEQLSWFERLKQSFSFEKVMEALHVNKYTLINIALFATIGFFIGFFWKRYANYIIALFLFIGALIILQQLDFFYIEINWNKIQECCGVVPVESHTDIFNAIFSWAKINLIILLSFLIGFSFGTKVS